METYPGISAVPSAKVSVKYGNLVVDNGNELTPTQVYDKPSVTWDAESGSYYTLIMVDPDIPPQFAVEEILHWLVVNVPGNDPSKGKTLFDYVGSGAPEGTGLHRYIFLVFKQNGLLKEESYSSLIDGKLGKIETRRNTTVRSINDLLKLGSPVAANFFRAQYDQNVPKFREEVMKKFS